MSQVCWTDRGREDMNDVKVKITSDVDEVERLLSMRAYANPQYILTQFMENSEEENMEEGVFRQIDPIKKILTLINYSKKLSKLSTLLSDEYLEIAKVSI